MSVPFLSAASGESSLSLGLAPMEGVTDLAMRLWLSICSAPSEMTTPFLRATYSFPQAALPEEFAPENTILAGLVSYSLIPQVMASSSEHFKRTFALLINDCRWVDFNCGCPAPKVVGHGA